MYQIRIYYITNDGAFTYHIYNDYEKFEDAHKEYRVFEKEFEHYKVEDYIFVPKLPTKYRSLKSIEMFTRKLDEARKMLVTIHEEVL